MNKPSTYILRGAILGLLGSFFSFIIVTIIVEENSSKQKLLEGILFGMIFNILALAAIFL